jgi:hypothetical protein
MRMISVAIGGMKIGRGNRSTRRKPTWAPLCPPQNPTWQTRSRNLDRSGGKPATNRLSYGAAFFSPILSPHTTRRVTVEVFDPASTRVLIKVLSQPLPGGTEVNHEKRQSGSQCMVPDSNLAPSEYLWTSLCYEANMLSAVDVFTRVLYFEPVHSTQHLHHISLKCS